MIDSSVAGVDGMAWIACSVIISSFILPIKKTNAPVFASLVALGLQSGALSFNNRLLTIYFHWNYGENRNYFCLKITWQFSAWIGENCTTFMFLWVLLTAPCEYFSRGVYMACLGSLYMRNMRSSTHPRGLADHIFSIKKIFLPIWSVAYLEWNTLGAKMQLKI